MSRAGLDALLADADALASRLAADDPTDARAVVEGLAAAVRDLRDDRDRALERLGAAVQLPSLRVETRGRMVWDSLHVVECRGASGTLPPEWDVRDETGCAYAMSCPTREDAERVAAMLRAVAARLKPFEGQAQGPAQSSQEEKWQRLLSGEQVVASDDDLDYFEQRDESGQLASIPNPRQVGTRDRWVAFLKPRADQLDLFQARKQAQQEVIHRP